MSYAGSASYESRPASEGGTRRPRKPARYASATKSATARKSAATATMGESTTTSADMTDGGMSTAATATATSAAASADLRGSFRHKTNDNHETKQRNA